MFKGIIALSIFAGIVWFFWMTFVAVRRTRPKKENKDEK